MRRGMFQRVVAVAAIAAIATFAAVTPASAAPEPGPRTAAAVAFQPNAVVRIWNYHTGNCILARGPYDNSPVVQWAGCANAHYADQDWVFTHLGTDSQPYYRVANANSGKCLLTRTDNNLAIQFTCLNFADQQWYVDIDTTGYFFMLRNRNSGHCLVVQAHGTQAFQYPCYPQYADQWWYLTA